MVRAFMGRNLTHRQKYKRNINLVNVRLKGLNGNTIGCEIVMTTVVKP